MAMEEKIQMGSHKLTLQNRGSVMLTGVKDVVVFDENQVVLDTELGLLTIKGKNLHMNRLTLEKGEADLEGQIDSLAYSSNLCINRASRCLTACSVEKRREWWE